MFHCLARSCADLLIGGPGSVKSKHAWVEVYRAVSHGPAKAACEDKATMAKFPMEIRQFAEKFTQMQHKRHEADYDPYARLPKTGVLADIAEAEIAIANFLKAPAKDRRAFAAWVLFRSARRK
jgi:hypothetical protein